MQIAKTSIRTLMDSTVATIYVLSLVVKIVRSAQVDSVAMEAVKQILVSLIQ